MKQFLAVVIALAAAVFVSPAFAADIGVVLMHGKWGNTNPGSPTGKLARAIEGGGFLVEFRDMPWSRERAYDKDVEGALAEIDAAVKRLKDKGAARIVIAGQSLGANIAMAYGAHRDGLAGIMAISPGHVPESVVIRPALAGDVTRAREMIAAGKGAEKESFLDINQGERKNLSASAQIYLSWMDPEGVAVMPKSATQIKPGTPFFWIVGEKDSIVERGKGYAFDKVPAHPKNAYVVIPGGAHGDTQTIATPKILEWLKAL